MKVAVLVSGGVDSSVALRLLKDQGHEITAFYLKIWLEDELATLGTCPWEDDLSYVRNVCEAAQVPLEVISLQKEYWDHVVSYTIDEIKKGRTPNPDMFCNKTVKFGFFFDKIDASYEKIATGHYAKTVTNNGLTQLHSAPDLVKDQTYFLAYVNQQQLSRIIFPLGDFNKVQVRELAHEFDLANKDRKDSQGICFLGKLKFPEFVKHYLGEKTGDIIEIETNKKIGEHQGFWFYTVGQRSGMGLAGGPWYVVEKDIDKNIIYASRNYYAEDKNRDYCEVVNINWIAGVRPEKNNLKVKLRHGINFHDCSIEYLDATTVRVRLHKRDQGIAAGQFAVFYDENVCLGGGIISKSL